MRVCALCSVHGGEPYPEDLYGSLVAEPVDGVTPVLGNVEAVRQGRRYIDIELAYSARPNPDSTRYEERRSAELREMFSEFDLVLSFHNARFPGPDAAYVNPTVDPRMTRVMAALGIRHALYEDDELDRGIPHMMSVELALTYDAHTPEYRKYRREKNRVWLSHLAMLAELNSLDDLPEARVRSTTDPYPDITAIQFYEFVRAIEPPEAQRLGLGQILVDKAFDPLPPQAAELLGVDEPLYIMNWNGGNYDPDKFFGALARSCDPHAAGMP